MPASLQNRLLALAKKHKAGSELLFALIIVFGLIGTSVSAYLISEGFRFENLFVIIPSLLALATGTYDFFSKKSIKELSARLKILNAALLLLIAGLLIYAVISTISAAQQLNQPF